MGPVKAKAPSTGSRSPAPGEVMLHVNRLRPAPPVELVSGGKSKSNTVILSKHLDGGGVREAQNSITIKLLNYFLK